MDPERGQQRRLVFALAVTTLLVPLYFVIGRSPSNDNAALSVTATTGAGGGPVSVPGTSDVMGSVPLGYLTGNTEDTSGALPTIVIASAAERITTRATFKRGFSSASVCLVPGAPTDEKVTVVNTDNGRGVQCTNSVDPDDYADRSDPEFVVLQTDAFLKIADLTDAPVPVEVSW